MRQEIIAELKQELHRMEVASQPHEFEKHLYAMERLLGLLKSETGSVQHPAPPAGAQDGQMLSEEDRMMLEQMGGKVSGTKPAPATRETLRTDDGFGNGESLFDF
ncbi:DUF5327 family protein [Salinicoccus sp. RF5]|uniref:DUF5327 family protein n=1 Tax=Salinicoccus sp. RF5 TaxID=2748874 RepID=UPI001E3C33FB|nr:DUF5327 family protein [Salinicoccus sp. RF5]MCC4722843.1 YwdI family protein [Salinicoccus sp. RF5]